MKTFTGKLPLGCQMCAKGAKMVLFVTGACDQGCFYCPLSKKRQEDVSFANERPVKTPQDIVTEAETMGALGAGVTGGNPLVKLERTCAQIKLLKDAFGEKFHVHIYLPSAKMSQLEKLNNVGVDEVRFHWGDPKDAMEFSWDIGGEVPLVPNWRDKTLEFLSLLEKREAKFCNLNELEISATNAAKLGEFEFVPRSEMSFGIAGSETLGLELLKTEIDLNLHYCSSQFKDTVQLRQRYLRTAKNVAKDYETVTDEGTIISGVIEKRVKIKEPHYILGKSTYCAPKTAKKYAQKWPAKLVEWIPSFDREVREVTPLSR